MLAVESWESLEAEAPDDSADRLAGGSPGRRLAAALTAVVAAAVVINVLAGGTGTGPDPGPAPTAYRISAPDRLGILEPRVCAVPAIGGLALRAGPGAGPPAGTATETRRCNEPGRVVRQAAVVRRETGGFGRESAVITWPLSQNEVTVTGLQPSASGARKELAWPVAGQYARIRGDLPEDELLELARSTVVGSYSLLVSVSADYNTAYLGRHSPDVLHEIRYDPPALGPDHARLFGGPVVAGVQNGVTLEDDLYTAGTREVGRVGRRPLALGLLPGVSVVWELPGGQLAYVRSSRRTATPALVAALVRLAQRAAVLDQVEFDALAGRSGSPGPP